MGPPTPKRDPLLGPSGGQKSHKTDDEAFLEFLVVRMSKNDKNGHFWLFLAIFVIFWTTFEPYLVELCQNMRQISPKFDHFCVVPTNCELFLWQKVSK